MACLFIAVLEWAHVPWHEHLQAAKLIVAGEVVEIAPDSTGQSVAKLKVDRVLKGKCGDEFLSLPFKPERAWGCDYPIEYEMKRYLLCIDDKNFFRVIHYPSFVSQIIPDYEAPAVRFTKAILANDIPELGRVAAEPDREIRDAAFEYALTKSRRQLKPILADLRKAYGESWRDRLKEAPPERRFGIVCDAVESTFDPTLLPDLVRLRPDCDLLPKILSRATGHNFATVRAFELWWEGAVKRAKAKGTLEEAQRLLPLLAEDIATRSAAREAILDLGPEVLGALEGDDPEVVSIREELELVADLRR